MGDADEPGAQERCVLPCLALRSLLGALSAAVCHGGVPGRGPQMRNAVQPLQSHAGCWGGRGGPFRTMPTAGGGELLSPTPNSGDSSSICTVTLGSAPSSCPSALPRAAQLPALHPSGPWNGQGGEEACAAARAVAPSTEPARFSRVSESRCTAGCSWLKCLVQAAHGVMLTVWPLGCVRVPAPGRPSPLGECWSLLRPRNCLISLGMRLHCPCC